MAEPVGTKVLLGGDPLPEGQQVVTCCERCGTGRYADHTTMRCASCGGPLFDTRTGKVVSVADPPARAGYLMGELAPPIEERRRAEDLPKVPVPYAWDDAPALPSDAPPGMSAGRVEQLGEVAKRSFVAETQPPPPSPFIVRPFIPPPIELTREAYEALRDSTSPHVRRFDLPGGLRVTLVACDAVPPGEALVFAPPDGPAILIHGLEVLPREKH